MTVAPLITPARTRPRFALQTLALAAVYLGVAEPGLHINMVHGSVPPVWLPAGVALAGLLLLGVAAWPAIFGGAVIANLGVAEPQGIVIIALGNTLAAVIPAWLLTRRSPHAPSLDRLGDTLRLLVYGTLLGPVTSALLGLLGLRLGASHAGVEDAVIALTWLVGYMVGTALFGLLLLCWIGPAPAHAARGSGVEAMVLGASLLAAAVLCAMAAPVYTFLAFPLIVWAALRFGSRGVTLVACGLLLLTVLAARAGPPPLEGPPIVVRLFYAALHVSCAATGLLLAASAAERDRAQRVERAAEDAYRALIAASPLAIIGLDLEARVKTWSHAAESLFGWRAEEVLGQPLPTIPPECEGEYRSMLAERGRPMSGMETVRRRKDGRLLHVLLNSWPLYDAEGRLSGSMSATADITDRQRAQQLQTATYRISEAALSAADPDQLYAAIHQIVGELMPARNFYIALYEATTETLSFPYWRDERDPPPAPRRAGKGLTEYVLRSGRPLRDRPDRIGSLVHRGEVEALGSSGVDWLGVPLVVAGRTIGVLAVQSYEDGVRYDSQEQAILEFVSSQVAMAIERKRADAALRSSEEELRALFTAMQDVILVIDRNGRYLKVAPSRPDLLYAPPAELIGKTLQEVFPREVADRFMQVIREILDTGEPNQLEYALNIRGEEVWFSATASRMDRDTVIWVARSIDEQRKAEAALRLSEDQLRHAARMEAVGRLAGGVAHDFNNLLTSVLGHADMALMGLSPGNPLHDDLLEIKAAGARAAGLTHQLLAFSRKQVLESRVVDLNAIVAGVTRMLRRTIGEDIELVTRLAPDLLPVRADSVQMEQVLVNLAVNARDAMPDGGRLSIETTNIRLPGGAGVRIRVQDTGTGMTEEVCAHLFEPFFTTKEVGKGTGLGLATAYGIVQQSGGNISVTSEPGQGATFTIDLPQAVGEPVSLEPQNAPVVGGGTETILLVEDEESVRNLTRRVLEQSGYLVLSAPNGEAAIEISRHHPDPIQLLLTDVVMPGISGPRLAELLHAERPSIRCLFMSGYAATLDQRLLLHGESSFLQKPFTAAQLARRIREAIDAPEISAGGAGEVP